MSKLKKCSFVLIVAILLLICNCVNPTYAMLPNGNYALNLATENNVVLEDNGEEPPVTPSEPEEPDVPTEPELIMPSDEQLGPVIDNDESGIPDSNLYQLLVGVFNEQYKNASNFVRQSQLRVNMLSTCEEINFANMRIISINGLNKLNLPSLKKLNLGANSISNIKTEDLKHLSSLNELYLYENNLTEITIPASLSKLNVLNLNANKLSKIDISGINSGLVSLGFNKFKSISDISFPRKIIDTNLTVELFNNNICDADEMYNSNGVLTNGGQITIELGIQGIGLNYKTTDDESEKITPIVSRDGVIKFYNVNDSYNLEVVIKKIVDNSVVATLSNVEDKKITELVLPVGDYKLEYQDKTTHENLYNYYNPRNCAFKDLALFNVIPKSPTVKFIVGGKEYDEYNTKFTSWDAKIVATNNEAEGELYYSISGGEWVKGSEFKLTRGGQYFISFKVVSGELSSNSVTRQVYMSQNPYVPDLIMLILVGAVLVIMFFVIIPILVKKFIKN